jgi:hypothetical protein
MKEISRVGILRQALTGHGAEIQTMQKGGPEMGIEALNDEQRSIVRAFYERDYQVFGKWFVSERET